LSSKVLDSAALLGGQTDNTHCVTRMAKKHVRVRSNARKIIEPTDIFGSLIPLTTQSSHYPSQKRAWTVQPSYRYGSRTWRTDWH